MPHNEHDTFPRTAATSSELRGRAALARRLARNLSHDNATRHLLILAERLEAQAERTGETRDS